MNHRIGPRSRQSCAEVGLPVDTFGYFRLSAADWLVEKTAPDHLHFRSSPFSGVADAYTDRVHHELSSGQSPVPRDEHRVFGPTRMRRRAHRDGPGRRIVTAAIAAHLTPAVCEYADVAVMLRHLGELDVDSHAYRRVRDRIVERCIPLADHIAQRYSGRGEARDDLQQVARLGLVKAVTRFDAARGVAFVGYAVPTIAGEIKRHFRDFGWSVHVPRRFKELHVQIGTATAELSQRLCRAPTATELAAELNVDRKDILDALIAGSGYSARSMDGRRVGGNAHNGVPIQDTLGTIDGRLTLIENRESLRPLLAALSDRERTVLMLRFFEGMSQSQIGARLGMSQMHVSRLLARTLAHLRDELMTG